MLGVSVVSEPNSKNSSSKARKEEIDRISEAYEQYSRDQRARTHWSPSNPGNIAIASERDRVFELRLRQSQYWPLSERHVLDIGCGTGSVLAKFLDWNVPTENLHGVDLLSERIQAARLRYPNIDFKQGNAEILPFYDDSMDLILTFTVFSSILDDQMAEGVANEAIRVLKPGGAILWYNFRFDNPYNRNTRGMDKPWIQQLFPGFDIKLSPITLLPPLARRLGQMTRLLYPVFGSIRTLRTHYVGLLMKPAQ